MPIQVIARPDIAQWTPEEFIRLTQRFSIGLDGIVYGASWWDFLSKHANINHHGFDQSPNVRATCEQVYVNIVQGLFQAFKNGNDVHLAIYVNDCDEDVCLAIFLLLHRKMIGLEDNGKLRRLVETEGKIDAFGGTYRISLKSKIWGELAYIFEPYRKFRLSGEIFQKDPKSYLRIIQEVGDRIEENINSSKSPRIELTREMLAYDTIGGGDGWRMIVEKGEYGRQGAVINDRVETYVSVRDRHDGTYTYTIGKISEWIPADLEGLCAHLNELEGLTDSSDRWGGSKIVIGSPRVAGTGLKPKDVEKIFNEFQLRK